MSHIINAHPQKAEIIADIVAGVQSKLIVNKYHLNPVTLSRFRTKHVKPAMMSVDVQKLTQSIDFIDNANSDTKSTNLLDNANQARQMQSDNMRLSLASQYAHRVRETAIRRDRMLALAEANEDVRGFSSVDSNVLKALELEGRFAGALNEANVVNTINIAVIEQPQDLAPGEMGECIDIEADPLL